MPRTASEITQDAISTLVSTTPDVTNFNLGSLVRGLMDALGAEAALIEQETVDQVAQATLNAPYAIWQVAPRPAVASVYQLQFANSTSSAIPVTQGYVATISGSSLQWATQSPLTVPANSTATVNAVCSQTGSQTNVPANTITVLASPIAGLTVTNPSGQAIIQGADAETETQTQARLSDRVASVHRGDPKALKVGALTAYIADSAGNVTEQVVKAIAPDLAAGKAVVYGSNGVGAMSSALLTQLQNVVNGYTDSAGVVHSGYKAAGVICTAYDAVQNAVTVAVQVLPQPGQTLAGITPQVQSAIQTFFAQLDIGQGLSISNLILAIRQVPGVADVLITSPSASLAGPPYVANPATAPLLTAVSGSTALAAGSYDVAVTFTNLWGETVSSTSASVTLTAGQTIQVSAITLPLGATGVNYYLSEAAGSSTVLYDASGSGAQTQLTALPASGAVAPPLANTALIQGNLYVLQGTPSVTQMAA